MKPARAAITPKKKTSKPVAPRVEVAPPVVNVDIAAAQVNVDTKAFAKVLEAMAKQINVALSSLAIAIADHDTRLVKVAAVQTGILESIEKTQKIAVANKKPDNFYVEFEQQDGDTIGFKIGPRSMN